MTVSKESHLPAAVILASEIDWGVFVDAFLTDAAKVGGRYAAKVYRDRSGRAADGSTVVTPPLIFMNMNGVFKLFRSSSGGDHYVVVSEHHR